eukprot:6252480-Pyramimonas_sp.AAC.1
MGLEDALGSGGQAAVVHPWQRTLFDAPLLGGAQLQRGASRNTSRQIRAALSRRSMKAVAHALHQAGAASAQD